jgi:type II secretory pathway pseudopilin PulG
MKAQPTAGLPGNRPPLRGDERGFLLVMVMVVMLVISTMIASTLVNSFLERSLAKNQNYASVALQASEGGLAAGVTWIRENAAALPNPYTANPNWTQTLTRSLPSGGTYQVTMRFKREWRDVNGNGTCTDAGEDSGYKDVDGSPAADCPGDIVLYNHCTAADNCFGFPDSLYMTAGQGYPVIEIDSVGYFGNDPATASSFREIALDLARNKVDVKVKGAVTARSNVTVTGSGYVDGHNFNLAGTATSATCSDLPAVTVAAGSTLTADCTAAANPPGGNPKGTFSSVGGCNDSAGVGLSKNPWDALGVSQADFANIFSPTTTLTSMPGTAASPAYVWQKGDALVNTGNGYGILVVHNENFDPDVWDVSCRTCPGAAGPDGAFGTGDDRYNVGSPNYRAAADSTQPGYDATYAPAELRLNGTCSFTGIIIADKILRVNGTMTTVGAVISTGGVSVDGDITGNWSAKYSCDAIEKALGGFGYGTRIAWHRLR